MRFVKPSEIRRNPRKHYSPRPLGTFPYNTTAFCERKRVMGAHTDAEYSQLCNATRVPLPTDAARVVEQLEAGGVEQSGHPYADLDSNDLLGKGGIHSRYFDLHRYDTPKAWVINDEGVPVPPTKEPSSLELTPTPPTPLVQNVLLAPASSKSIDTGVLEASSDPLDSGMKELRRLGVDVVQWACNVTEEPAPMLLRSPIMDSCNASRQIVGTLPVEFMCDFTSGRVIAERASGIGSDDDVASPPLMWNLASDKHSNGRIGSFVLFLEDTVTHRVHWFVKDIPANVRSLGVGASRTVQIPESAMELPNSFHISGYTGPCIEPNSPPSRSLYRFHLFARSETKIQLPESAAKGTLDSAALVIVLEDSMFHATLDTVLANPEFSNEFATEMATDSTAGELATI